MFYRHQRENSFGKGLGVGIIGTLASVITAYYLFATEDGNEKLEKTADFFNKAKKKAVKSGEKLKETFEEKLQDKKEDAEEILDGAKDKLKKIAM